MDKRIQESIAKAENCTHPTVKKIIEDFVKKGQMAEIYKTFKNQLYNIWNYQGAKLKTGKCSLRKRGRDARNLQGR